MNVSDYAVMGQCVRLLDAFNLHNITDDLSPLESVEIVGNDLAITGTDADRSLKFSIDGDMIEINLGVLLILAGMNPAVVATTNNCEIMLDRIRYPDDEVLDDRESSS